MSHANSTNIAKMRYYDQHIAVLMKLDVFAYEYRGYGGEKKSATDVSIIQDATNAYNFLVNEMKYKPS